MQVSDVFGWGIIALIGVCTVWAAAMPMLASRARRPARDGSQRRGWLDSGGVSAGMAGGIDEVFHPTGHQARLMWQAQQELPAPAPSPGDPPDLDSGRVVIDLRDEHT